MNCSECCVYDCRSCQRETPVVATACPDYGKYESLIDERRRC